MKIEPKNIQTIGRVISVLLPAICLGSLASLRCSKTEAPELLARIVIVSGDHQYSLHGTQLPEPLVVRVKTDKGSNAEEAGVFFKVIQGGGNLSRTSIRTDYRGIASSRLTLGPVNGINIVKAFIAEDTSQNVTFTETAADYYCPEAELTLSVTYGTRGNLFLATPKSGLYQGNSGIVQIDPSSQTAWSFLEFVPDIFITVIRDVAFSPRGDLYLARSELEDEIVKISPDGSVSHFSRQDDIAELTTNPSGLLVGCDARGPFIVGCRDTLMRFGEAFYPGGGINNDAVAVDPLTEDVYFIYEPNPLLLRLPLDSLFAEGPVDTVTSLTQDEASGARGMVCDWSGFVYVLVDADSTKSLLRIDASGSKEIFFDFFSRGDSSLAGVQRDLAFDPYLRIFYTLDVLNDELLGIRDGQIVSEFSSQDLSVSFTFDERVGLAVLP